MVAETKLGFFYLLNVNTMTKYQVGGGGVWGVSWGEKLKNISN